jgi:hypothetical protein
MPHATAGNTPKLLAISDLRVSFPENREFIEKLRPDAEGDWLLLAGDAGEIFADIEWVLRTLSGRFSTMVWTPGHHEPWTHPDDPVQARGAERSREAWCHERVAQNGRRLAERDPALPFVFVAHWPREWRRRPPRPGVPRQILPVPADDLRHQDGRP